MRIFAYKENYDKACIINIPQELKESYISTFGVQSPSLTQVEKWSERKGYDVKQRGSENEFICIKIGD